MFKSASISKSDGNFNQSAVHFIVYLMVLFLPHIYRYREFIPKESEKIFFKNPVYADLYLLGKSQMFLIMTILLIGMFMYQLYKKQVVLIRDKVNLVALLFALVIVISSLASDYSNVVYFGAKDRFEGMWVWLAYIIVFVIVRHYGHDKTFVQKVLKYFTISSGLMAIFGLLQVFGYDIYTVGILRWLAFPKEMAMNIDQYMVSNVTEAGAVGALFNSNYFGVYVGISTLIALGFTFTSDSKSTLYLVLAVLQYGAMIASKSEAALLGFAVAIALFVMIYGDRIIKRKWYAMIILLFSVAVDRYLAMNLLYRQSGNALWIYALLIIGIVIGFAMHFLIIKNDKFVITKKLSLVLSLIMVMMMTMAVNIGIGVLGSADYSRTYSKISYDENILTLESQNDNQLALHLMDSGINAYDKEMNSLQPELMADDQLKYIVDDIQYIFTFKHYNNGVLLSFISPHKLNIFFDGEKMQYVNPISSFDDIVVPKRIDYYYKHGSAYTNRAYIWSNYLPIAVDNLLLGKGVDTYLIAYPQNDYFGKTMFYPEGDHLIVDKPHSLYLDILFGTGIIGLIVLLAFVIKVGMIFFDSLKNQQLSDTHMFALLSVIMILVTGIFNDSVIPITVLLCCFSGMGFMIHGEKN